MKLKYLVIAWLTLGTGGIPLVYAGEGQLPSGVQMYRGGEAVEDDSGFAHIIYTKDVPEKVMAFYRKTLGMEPIQGRSFYLGDNHTGTQIDSGPVYLTVKMSAEREDSSISESDLFDTLHEEMQEGSMMGRTGHSEHEFQQLKQKYAHLAKGWYPTIDAQEKLNACMEGAGSGSEDYGDQSEADAARIQALVAQGRYEEATNLANKSAQAGMAAQNEAVRVHWDEWVSCFKELDRHDYQVQILIGKIYGDFAPATANGRENAIRRLNEQKSEHSDEDKSNNDLMDKGMDSLKGILGL